MSGRSLRLRLLLVSALAIIIALTASGYALSALFEQHIVRAEARTLTDELNRLAALVEAEAKPLRLEQPMADPRFDVPYGGIYWQVRDPGSGEIIRSRSMWDKSFDTAGLTIPANGPGQLTLTDPEGASATAIARLLSFELGDGSIRPLELIVAQDGAARNAALAAYQYDLFRALLVLGIILVLAAWAQVALGLAPLDAIRRGVSAIRTGRAKSLTGSYPSEVQPLVTEVNELMQSQELSIQFARERAADLAHGLKGKLQVLNAEAFDLRQGGQPAAADAIEALTAEMADTIDHQLGLTRLRRRSARPSEGSDLGLQVERMVRALGKTERGAELDWQVDIAAGTKIALDSADLSELLGALLENAAKWGKTTVRITGLAESDVCRMTVEDDGQGLSDADLARLGERGVRLDEAQSGSGIGLSIVREIVALNGGTLAFARSGLGGLAVSIGIPGAA